MREAAPAEAVLREKLFSLQDLKYREFQSKLIPTIDSDTVIGVRTPDLRKLSKEFAKTEYAEQFIKCLPHEYYEENNVHGFIIEAEKDYGAVIEKIENFLPYIDNWATCDLISPKVFKKHLPELFEKIKEWTKSEHTYTVRFGIGMLMRYYLDKEFKAEYLEIPAQISYDEYYINMMIAWYFATALAKQYDAALPYIENRRLDRWTHNKAIQKAIESYRVSAEQKAYLRTLRIK
ncbi:MAG: DNA alkylation repair protein [Eubacteriales Family XIII. Incertae Sedis bacterium]|nr:MAG: DNA alkylation repair protein [Clostridiales Family XIII bacterium]